MRKFLYALVLASGFNSTALLAAKTEWKRLNTDKVEASSYLKSNWNKYTENYHPNYLFDDNAKTAWVEGAEGLGEGEQVQWQVSPQTKARKLKLRLRNGYQKSAKLFAANSRPTEVSLILSSRSNRTVFEKTVPLKNAQGWQQIELNFGKPLAFSAITLRLNKVAPGKVYKDTCLSDIQTFVVTGDAYDPKTESLKAQDLSHWIRERVKDAAYYAKLPAKYPFVSTQYQEAHQYTNQQIGEFTDDGKIKVLPGMRAFGDQLIDGNFGEKEKTFFGDALSRLRPLIERMNKLKEQSVWYKGVASTKITIPDLGVAISEEVEFFADQISAEATSYFETDSHVGPPETPRKVTVKKQARSTYRLEKKSDVVQAVHFTVTRVVSERGVYNQRLEFLLVYDGSPVVKEALVVSYWADQPPSFSWLRFTGQGGKVENVEDYGAGYDHVDGGFNSYAKTIAVPATALAEK